jgi:hypothetical protein
MSLSLRLMPRSAEYCSNSSGFKLGLRFRSGLYAPQMLREEAAVALVAFHF